MLRRWLERLIGPKPPGFQYRFYTDGAQFAWRCMLCEENVIALQLAFHARERHGWHAPNVRIEPSRNG